MSLFYVYLPPKLLYLSVYLLACLCNHPVFSASFILLFTIGTASVADCLFLCLYISLLFSPPPLWIRSTSLALDCISPHFFFLCPTSSFCSFPSSSPPVLIWKCFGLQRMMVDIEEIERPYGQICNPFQQPKYSMVKITERALYMQRRFSPR